jgi:hypothetical protein
MHDKLKNGVMIAALHFQSARLDSLLLRIGSGLRLPAVGTLKRYSKGLEYEYRVKTAALDTLKRYSIFSLTLYIE